MRSSSAGMLSGPMRASCGVSSECTKQLVIGQLRGMDTGSCLSFDFSGGAWFSGQLLLLQDLLVLTSKGVLLGGVMVTARPQVCLTQMDHPPFLSCYNEANLRTGAFHAVVGGSCCCRPYLELCLSSCSGEKDLKLGCRDLLWT